MNLVKIVADAIPRIKEVFRRLIGMDVDAEVRSVDVADTRNTIDILCEGIDIAACVYTSIENRGVAMLLMDLNLARRTIADAMAKHGLTEMFNEELAEDLVKELGNEVVGSVLSALSRHLGVAYRYGVPLIVVESCRAIIGEFIALHSFKHSFAAISLNFVLDNRVLPMKLLLSL